MEAHFVAKKRFFDNKNYPRGFSRQGDFTIKEAQLLEKHGESFKDLVSGKRQPETELEKSFVDAVNNNKAPSNEYEKVWMKYQRLISKVKKFHTLSGGKPQLEGAEDYSDSDE